MSEEYFIPREFKKDFSTASFYDSYSLIKLWDEGKQYATIPIQELCHTTHEKIKKSYKDYYYVFQPKQRTMNTTAGTIRVDGETARPLRPRTSEDEQQEQQEEQHQSTSKDFSSRECPLKAFNDEIYLFPGHLSWWSIDVQHWYKTDQGKRLRAAVREFEREKKYVPHTIQATPISRYGNYRFSISFEDIVTSYVSSRRKHCRSKNVYLLKAGTLVYNYEICYVIMVCMEDDRNEIDELNKMPILHIINNGEEDTVDVSTTLKSLSFKAKHIVRATYDATLDATLNPSLISRSKENYHYEELAFAFYFKSNDEKLCCEESKVTSSVVDHQPRFCAQKGCPVNIPHQTPWEL